ncbi:hypothetical protein NDU88_009509 [Pleurodeles waltl]|uniref:Sacsin/Nov domain-containing protein n=1 Tax=Pleurodeles waltl TaxID=8319 RepID=A0AAV7PSE7_PLEWA|nr:hypothetical protein NDU88_009509 [Pleurodeles waltl]
MVGIRYTRNSFSQKTPPYLVYLQNILHKYPDGGQILKELLQNADDAGGSKVIFFLDERDYGTETLYSNELADFQGPALFAYNNATFSDSDWEGIQNTGKSIKLKDPNTVGRFGLGFSSVYHITDIPAVLSGKYIGMLDPQWTAFDDGGFKWNLEDNEDQNDIKALTDQFLSFSKAVSAISGGKWDTIIESGFFNGTLFRFPLRLSFSKISDNLYSSEKVQELFRCFRKDATINLLFLRNITQVALKIIGRDGTVKDLMTASVNSEDNKTFQNIDVSSSKLLSSLKVKATSLKSQGRMDEECRWLVVGSTIKKGSFQDLEDLANRLNNFPTISVAYSLEHADNTFCEGRLCCFLPLPDREENKTQLPVHINASFDLTDDRRSIKWVEADQQDDSAQWNHLLVEKVLPLVYCQAVQAVVSFVRSSGGPATLAYGIWPDPSQTQHKQRWHRLTKRIAIELLNMDVLCPIANNIQWLKPSHAIFLPIIEDCNIIHALEELLVCVGEPLVKVPPHVIGVINLAAECVKTATPSFIRKILK